MKKIAHTLLAMTILSFPTSYVLAQTSDSNSNSTSGSATAGVGVGSQGGSVGMGTNTAAGSSVNTGTRTDSASNSSLNDSPTSNTGAGVNGTLGVDGTRHNAPSRTSSSSSNNTDTSTGGSTGTSSDSTRNTSASTSTSGSANTLSTTNLDQPTIRSIQEALNERGYNVGTADGRWGTSTAAQLRRFEQNQGLAPSTGASLSIQSLQQLGVGVNNISPAAGSNNTPSTRVQSRSQGTTATGN